MQNINQKHHGTPEWTKKYEEGVLLLQYAVDLYWDQIARGKFFLHEHPATASSWGFTNDKRVGRTSWGGNCYRGHV